MNAVDAPHGCTIAALTLLPPVSGVVADVGGAHEPGQLALVAPSSARRVLDGCLQVRGQRWLCLLLHCMHAQSQAQSASCRRSSIAHALRCVSQHDTTLLPPAAPGVFSYHCSQGYDGLWPLPNTLQHQARVPEIVSDKNMGLTYHTRGGALPLCLH